MIVFVWISVRLAEVAQITETLEVVEIAAAPFRHRNDVIHG